MANVAAVHRGVTAATLAARRIVPPACTTVRLVEASPGWAMVRRRVRRVSAAVPAGRMQAVGEAVAPASAVAGPVGEVVAEPVSAVAAAGEVAVAQASGEVAVAEVAAGVAAVNPL